MYFLQLYAMLLTASCMKAQMQLSILYTDQWLYTNSNFNFTASTLACRRGRPSRIIGDSYFKVSWTWQFHPNWRHNKWRTP
jgi:hypothetical protein